MNRESAVSKLIELRLEDLKELLEDDERGFDVSEEMAELIEDGFFYAPVSVERDLKQLFYEWNEGYIDSAEFKKEIDKMIEQIKR